MKQSDAAKILGLDGQVSPAMVKEAFRAAAMKYHPDINPAGLEMMKIINQAYDALKDFTGSIDAQRSEQDYPEALNDAINAIINLDGLLIEICGAWVWVTGNTKAHKDPLKAAGYRFASKKKAWNFRPDNWKSASYGKTSLEKIREKYGSVKPHRPEYRPVSYAGA
ncbi:MAG: J domain-containing protein [Nitrospinaceae bacterium]